MGRINKYSKKMNRYEAQSKQRARVEYATQGTGRYIYKNRLKATLQLPKPGLDGKKIVEPDEEWEGDSYFMRMVTETREAFLVREIVEEPKQEKPKEQPMNEQKLILDQPETVTVEGVVERVAVQPGPKPINETNPSRTSVSMPKDVLINEDPASGVEIILGD